MFVALTAIFALVIAAGALVAAWLTMSASAAGVRLMDSRLKQVETTMSTATPIALRSEVDGLVGALDAMRASNRKEFGSIWGRLGGRVVENSAPGQLLPVDPAFDAMLALQRADSAR